MFLCSLPNFGNPSPPPSIDPVRTYRMDTTPSPPSSAEPVHSYRIDATPSPPPSIEPVRGYRMDATPSLPPSPKLGYSYRMDVTPSPPQSLSDPLRANKLPSPNFQDDSGMQGSHFPTSPRSGSSSNVRCKLCICSSYMRLSSVHAGWEWGGGPPSPSNSEWIGQPDNVGAVESTRESVCQSIHVPV